MQGDANRLSWFQVPEDVKELLVLATQTWENTGESANYMQQALAKTGENTDVLVAAYRYFYYKNNYGLALTTVEKLIATIKKAENFPENWQQLQLILVQRQEEPQIRLYLNAYAASGLLLAKLGQLELAKEISQKIQDLNAKNHFGADILLGILTSPPTEED
jgi:tetratricopeptide (TPR) repeat protein